VRRRHPAQRRGLPPPPRPASVEDENEEPLVDTPTSFNLDLRRRPRSPASALGETLPTDPNSPEAIAAGDVDVNAESASAVGDEAPGGDNPTPDMDVVDLIGRSLGVEYDDREELKGADKIAQRDRKRWELDPKSSEDYKDRTR
jgi:hypothetical protein